MKKKIGCNKALLTFVYDCSLHITPRKSIVQDKTKGARCRLLLSHPDGRYECLAYGYLENSNICGQCPNPSYQTMFIN